MAKTLTIEFENKDYTLEFNRRVVENMERQGFSIDKVESMPMTMIPMLFAGAFIKNHPSIKRAKLEQIYDELPDKSDTIEALLEMLAETYESLSGGEESDGETKKAKVKRNF